MIVYSVLTTDDTGALVAKAFDVDGDDISLCSSVIPEVPAVGHIVRCTKDDLTLILADPEHIGADGSDAGTFNTWLTSSGVSQVDADSITGSGNIHAAMTTYISGQT